MLQYIERTLIIGYTSFKRQMKDDGYDIRLAVFDRTPKFLINFKTNEEYTAFILKYGKIKHE